MPREVALATAKPGTGASENLRQYSTPYRATTAMDLDTGGDTATAAGVRRGAGSAQVAPPPPTKGR